MEAFDYNKVLAATDGDKELAVEIIGIFQDQVPVILTEIDRAIQAGDARQLQQAAHTLKGASGNVGAMVIYGLALSLETVGKNNEMQKAAELLEKISEAVKTFEQATVHLKGASVE